MSDKDYTDGTSFENLIKRFNEQDKEIKELKEKLEKVTKISDEVCGFYSQSENIISSSIGGMAHEYDNEPSNIIYEVGHFARQKQKELKEILNKE